MRLTFNRLPATFYAPVTNRAVRTRVKVIRVDHWCCETRFEVDGCRSASCRSATSVANLAIPAYTRVSPNTSTGLKITWNNNGVIRQGCTHLLLKKNTHAYINTNWYVPLRKGEIDNIYIGVFSVKFLIYFL